MNSKAMFKLSYGLFMLSAFQDGKHNGCITNTAIQVANTPDRIGFAVNKGNLTHDMVKATGIFTLSILSENVTFSTFQRFGFQSGREVDKFEGCPNYTKGKNGLYHLTEGANAVIEGKVVDQMDLGSHTFFVAEITEMEVLSEVPSVTYSYYQEHIKPKPQAAPQTATGKTVWRCSVCGYEYEGEEIPADYICPLCKHPASDFDKIVK